MPEGLSLRKASTWLALQPIDRPLAVLGLLGVLWGLGAWFALGIVIDNDPRAFVAQDSEDNRFLDEHAEAFGPTDTNLIYILEADAAAPKRLLLAGERVAESLSADPDVLQVTALSHTSVPRRIDSETVLIAPLTGPESPRKLPPHAVLEAARAHPLGLSWLVDKEERRLLVAARLDGSLTNPVEARPVLDRLNAVVETTLSQFDSELRWYPAGVQPTRVASIEHIERDLLLLFPLSGLLLTLCLFAQFRSATAVALPLVAVGLTTTLSVGLAAAMNITLNPITEMVPILIMVLAVADGIHLLVRYQEELNSGLAPRPAMIRTVRSISVACSLTTATSALAFGSLLHTEMTILHDFGVLSALSLCIGLVVNLSLLPAGLMLSKARPQGRSEMVESFIRKTVTALTIRSRALGTVLVGIVLVVGSLWLAREARVDFFVSQILASDDPVSSGNTLLDTKFEGMMPLEVHLLASSGTFTQPVVLSALRKFERGLEEIGFARPFGPAALLGSMNETFGRSEGLPQSHELASQLLSIVEMSAPPGGQVLVTPDRSQARVITTSPDRGAARLLAQRTQVDALAETLLRPLGIEARLTGVSVISSSGFNQLTEELLEALTFALTIVLLAVGLLFRSARMALASLLPNVLPILLSLAWFGASNRHLDLFPAVLLTIAIGIAVDDSIHLLARYREELLNGRPAREAVVEASVHCVGAVTSTSIVLIFGFATLIFSSFQANVVTGVLGGTIVALALLADLIFAPAILSLLRPGAPKQ